MGEGGRIVVGSNCNIGLYVISAVSIQCVESLSHTFIIVITQYCHTLNSPAIFSTYIVFLFVHKILFIK